MTNDEVRFRNDAVIQSRISRPVLATLLTYYIRNRVPISSMSSMIRIALEDMATVLVNNGLVERCESQYDAQEVLERFGVNNLNPSKRNTGNMRWNMVEEDRLCNQADESYGLMTRTKTYKEMRKVDYINTASKIIRSGDLEKEMKKLEQQEKPAEEMSYHELLRKAEEQNKVPDLSPPNIKQSNNEAE